MVNYLGQLKLTTSDPLATRGLCSPVVDKKGRLLSGNFEIIIVLSKRGLNHLLLVLLFSSCWNKDALS